MKARIYRQLIVRTAAFVLLILGLAVPQAKAGAVTWYLKDIVFANGGTASGQFTVDVDTLTVSAINVTTTPDIDGSGVAYAGAGGGFIVGALDLVSLYSSNCFTNCNSFGLFLIFNSQLSNSGGEVSLWTPASYESKFFLPADGPAETLYSRSIVSGSLTTAPEPGTFTLLFGALAAGLWFRRARLA